MRWALEVKDTGSSNLGVNTNTDLTTFNWRVTNRILLLASTKLFLIEILLVVLWSLSLLFNKLYHSGWMFLLWIAALIPFHVYIQPLSKRFHLSISCFMMIIIWMDPDRKFIFKYSGSVLSIWLSFRDIHFIILNIVLFNWYLKTIVKLYIYV